MILSVYGLWHVWECLCGGFFCVQRRQIKGKGQITIPPPRTLIRGVYSHHWTQAD